LQGGVFDVYNGSLFGIGNVEGVDRQDDHADEQRVSTEPQITSTHSHDELDNRRGRTRSKIRFTITCFMIIPSILAILAIFISYFLL